jgi:hypothetical protein
MSHPAGKIEHMATAHLEVVPEYPIPAQAAPTLGPRAGRATAVRFSESVRTVVTLARRGGLLTPVFRSPPNRPGVDRTIRWRGARAPVVAITRRDRPLAAVQADMIEAVVVTNGLHEQRADRFRRAAWGALEQHGLTGAMDDPVTDLPKRSSGEASIGVAS